MRDLLFKRRRYACLKNWIFFCVFMIMASSLFVGQAMAIELELFGSPLTLKGFVNQSVQFGVAGDKYDTMQGFQQALTQALLEVDYYQSDNLKIFVSGLLVKDWAYNILSSDDDWEFRRFDESRSEVSLRNDYEDMLKECHVTWTPGDFNIRIGKQIVNWGRMDAVRIMDQINPYDGRLGPSDVEFESTIVPIWLAKAEYFPNISVPFVDELGIEFIFNPNADFIPDKSPTQANYESGIWAANITQSLPLIGDKRIGAFIKDFKEPDKWSDGREYGVRISTTLKDSTFLTLNFFDGVENNPVFMADTTRDVPLKFTGIYDDKGREIVEPYMVGYYPDRRFAGFTLARDLRQLYVESLGGVAPVLRCEALYEFDTTFTYNDPSNPLAPVARFEEHDVIFWGVGLDWKFKWRLLNPRKFFTLAPQFTHRHVRDYPSSPGTYLQIPSGLIVSENDYSFAVRFETYYLLDKLVPRIFYMRDIKQDVNHITKGSVKGDLWLFQLSYQPDSTWTFQTQLTLLENDGYDKDKGVGNKDNISFTVKYQF